MKLLKHPGNILGTSWEWLACPRIIILVSGTDLLLTFRGESFPNFGFQNTEIQSIIQLFLTNLSTENLRGFVVVAIGPVGKGWLWQSSRFGTKVVREKS